MTCTPALIAGISFESSIGKHWRQKSIFLNGQDMLLGWVIYTYEAADVALACVQARLLISLAQFHLDLTWGPLILPGPMHC